jgi:DNA modification methylase
MPGAKVKSQKRRSEQAANASVLSATKPDTRFYIGDCRVVLANVPEVKNSQVDLVFADPPFNWNRDYNRKPAASLAQASGIDYQTWDDAIAREDYIKFTHDWLSLCHHALKPSGSMFVNIPDDTAADIVIFLRDRLKMHMVNWGIWHYRFGQNRTGAFINSKVHVLYFAKDQAQRIWRPEPILEPSDRATTYFDPRTLSKNDGMPAGMRVPMDVWYGPFMGRVQGNNIERRPGHDNQLPEAYLSRVVQCCTDKDMLVMDPFIGSGTTSTVARALGRRFIGSEYSAANAHSAFERTVNIGPMRDLHAVLAQSSSLNQARTTTKNRAEQFELKSAKAKSALANKSSAKPSAS